MPGVMFLELFGLYLNSFFAICADPRFTEVLIIQRCALEAFLSEYEFETVEHHAMANHLELYKTNA